MVGLIAFAVYSLGSGSGSKKPKSAGKSKEEKYAKEDSAKAEKGEAAEGDENLMPHFIEASKANVTLGEMCDVLRGVFGEYREGSDF